MAMGTLVYSTGHKYTGGFKDGVRHGRGGSIDARGVAKLSVSGWTTRFAKGHIRSPMGRFIRGIGNFAKETARAL